MARLYQYNKKKQSDKQSYSYGGFLVLVPKIPLIKTWTDEIEKHTTGFDTYIQIANGKLQRLGNNSKKDLMKKNSLNIDSNTVIVSTMGRIRAHPISNAWILLVIDECLSVQNKEALQTEEAWRQSCYSQFGVVMLSATFFRSRFDKMLYMLKMLKTGLPEERVYLDSILSETIVSNIAESDRVWKINTTKIILDPSEKKEYDRIYEKYSDRGSEALYVALNKYIHDEIDYLDIFMDELDVLEKEGKRCVIFTNSKMEADDLIEHERNYDRKTKEYRIGRYPKKLKHTV